MPRYYRAGYTYRPRNAIYPIYTSIGRKMFGVESQLVPLEIEILANFAPTKDKVQCYRVNFFHFGDFVRRRSLTGEELIQLIEENALVEE